MKTDGVRSSSKVERRPKPTKKDQTTLVKTKELELVKVTRQVQDYRREIEQLQNKISQISGVERLMQLEQEHQEALHKKAELLKKVKELQKAEKTTAIALEKQVSEEDYAKKSA
jgi:predicted  nucleic acid-binding Zn-ribbon protein